jgi:Rho-binding antiterminator
MSDYAPIACALHDRLESIATLGATVRIEYVDDGGATQRADDRIVDVYARGGAEYLRLAGGLEIRLDHLETVDGIRYGSSC